MPDSLQIARTAHELGYGIASLIRDCSLMCTMENRLIGLTENPSIDDLIIRFNAWLIVQPDYPHGVRRAAHTS